MRLPQLIDTQRFEAFLKSEIHGLAGTLDLQPVAGGQSNPTFFANFDNRRLVVRKKPDGPLLPSAHAIEREYQVLQALGRTGVCVPRVLLLHAGCDLMGTPFYVMERVEGRIFHDSRLGSAPQAERAEMYRSMARMLAELHKVDFKAVGLSLFGQHSYFFSRQIARWTRQWQLSKAGDIPEIDQLIEWLPLNLPPESPARIVHGDFRIGNLVFHPTEPRVVAVLDWELSTLGHPMADLAHTCVYSWYLTPDDYGGILGLDLAEQGLPSMHDFISCYYAAARSGMRLNKFHMVLAMFRNAVIFQGIASRGRTGNAAADNAEKFGRLAPVIAGRALDLIESRDPF